MPGSCNCFALSQWMSPGTAELTLLRISGAQLPPVCGWCRASEKFLLSRRGRGHPACAQATPSLPGAEQGQPWAAGAAPKGLHGLISPLWASSGNGSSATAPTGALWHPAVSRGAQGRHHPSILPLPTERKAVLRLQGVQPYTAAATCLMILTRPKSVYPLIHYSCFCQVRICSFSFQEKHSSLKAAHKAFYSLFPGIQRVPHSRDVTVK